MSQWVKITMTPVWDKTSTGETVKLDGHDFVNCIFDGLCCMNTQKLNLFKGLTFLPIFVNA